MRAFISIFVLLLPSLVQAQINFSDSLNACLKRADVVFKPYIQWVLAEQFSQKEFSAKPSFGGSWDLALKADYGNSVILMQVLPDQELINESQWQKAAEVFGAEKIEGSKVSQSVLTKLNSNVGWTARVHSCNNASGFDAGKMYLLSRKGSGTLIIYVMATETSLANELVNGKEFIEAFRFKPEPSKYDGLAGIGAVYKYSLPHYSWYFNALAEGMPAHLQGILPGDRLLEVEGLSVEKMDYFEIYEKLTGLENTEVRVKVRRYHLDYEVKMERQSLPKVSEVKVLHAGNYDCVNNAVLRFLDKMTFTPIDYMKSYTMKVDDNGNKVWLCNYKIPPNLNEGNYIEKGSGDKQLEYVVYSGDKTEMDLKYKELATVLANYYKDLFFTISGDFDLGVKTSASLKIKAGIDFMGNVELECQPVSDGSGDYQVLVILELKQ